MAFVVGGDVTIGVMVVGGVAVTGGPSGNCTVDGVGTSSHVVGVTPLGKVSGGAVGGVDGLVVLTGTVAVALGTVVAVRPQVPFGNRTALSPHGTVVLVGVVVTVGTVVPGTVVVGGVSGGGGSLGNG